MSKILWVLICLNFMSCALLEGEGLEDRPFSEDEKMWQWLTQETSETTDRCCLYYFKNKTCAQETVPGCSTQKAQNLNHTKVKEM